MSFTQVLAEGKRPKSERCVRAGETVKSQLIDIMNEYRKVAEVSRATMVPCRDQSTD
jgi:hypothetical protein